MLVDQRAIGRTPRANALTYTKAMDPIRRLLADTADAREMGFGAWEGRRHEEVRDADHDAYYAFFRDAVNHSPPGSEPLDKFYARVRSGIMAVFDEHPEGHILLVCHLGVMRVATALALEMPLSALYRMHAPYAGRIRLRRTARGIELWFGH